MIRTLWGLLSASLVVSVWWIAGFDFNVRGAAAVTCYLVSIVAFVLTVTCPYRFPGENHEN